MTRGRGIRALVVACILAAAGGLAWSAGTLASGLRVPLPEMDFQTVPAVAVAPDGSIYVAWADNRNDPWDIWAVDIFMTRLDADGSPLWGGDLRVDGDPGPASQTVPRLVVASDGTLCVVWRDQRNGNWDIYMQRVSPEGHVLWPQDVRVNSDLGAADQVNADVAALPDGSCVVVWKDERDKADDLSDIYAQKVRADGTRLWPSDVRVNGDAHRARTQDWPRVAADEKGHIYVVWQDDHESLSPRTVWDVYMQRLAPEGSREWAGDLQVADAPAGTQWTPDIEVTPDGWVYVVWFETPGERTDPGVLMAQKFNADGSRQWGSDQQVSPMSLDWHAFPALAVDTAGVATVVWVDARVENAWDLYAQRLAPDGGAMWPQDVEVSALAPDAWQAEPAVAAAPDGDALVVWKDNRILRGSTDVWAQRFNQSGARVWTSDVMVNRNSAAPTTLWARYAERVPTVDGYDVDWLSRGEGVLDRTVADWVMPADGRKGAAARATLRAMWRPDALYLLIAVADETLHCQGQALEGKDRVEVALDGAHDRLPGGPDDRRYVVACDGSTAGDVAAVAVARQDAEYVVEMAIPAAQLGGPLETDRSLGLTFALWDLEAQGEAWHLVWEGTETEGRAHEFGHLVPVGSTVTFQYRYDAYIGVEDTFIARYDSPPANHEDDNHLALKAQDEKAALLWFDVSWLPPEATVETASLKAKTWTGSGTLNVGAYRVLRAWEPREVTWVEAARGRPWATPGCNRVGTDREGTPSAVQALSTPEALYSWDVTRFVRDWVLHPEANFGVVLKSFDGGTVQYLLRASETGGTSGPALVVSYRFPSPAPTPTVTP
ncbi:MAG: DNRLRE domain-containing protein, partial [Anaerolineae bacterium]